MTKRLFIASFVSSGAFLCLEYTRLNQHPSLLVSRAEAEQTLAEKIKDRAWQRCDRSHSRQKHLFPSACPNTIAAERRKRIEMRMRRIQELVCQHVELTEASALIDEGKKPKQFYEDVWKRDTGGGGVTRILQDGQVFEKAGVNVSVIEGKLPPNAINQMRNDHSGIKGLSNRDDSLPFFACGVSVVIHAHNPHVPTVHCNFRYFEIGEIDEEGEPEAWWIGGGADLTPSYLYEDDAKHFHSVFKSACDDYDESWYLTFKKWCDAYFFLKHRKECRGIGGIFFDDIDDRNRETLLNFLTRCGEEFNNAYFPIVCKRANSPFSDHQKRWQQLRRGRYVEFNLIWDRGTKFGLHTPDARIESILMSLPLTSRWEYMVIPDADSPEAKLENILRNPVDWI